MLNIVSNIIPLPDFSKVFASTATAPRRRLFELPQEIIDNILDHLAQTSDRDQVTRQTLRSCLLISRAFTRRAQQNLLLDISVSQRTWSRQQMVEILEILRREPFLFARLRSLQLCISSTTELSDNKILELAQMAASRCIDLKRLTFEGQGLGVYSFSPFYKGTISNITAIISSTQLTSLSLVHVVDIPAQSLSTIFACLHLQRLELIMCYFDDIEPGVEDNQDAPRFYQTLKSLHIANENNEFFMKIPAVVRGEPPRYSRLRSLSWEFSTVADVVMLRAQLQSAPSLEVLELTHRTNGELPPDISGRVQLGRQQNLEELTLNIITGPTHTLADILDCRILSTSAVRPVSSLQIININVTTYCKWYDIEDFMENDQCGWRNLDADLSKDHLYPCLTHVNLRFHLLPLPGKTLPSLSELRTEFSVLYRFRTLQRREGVRLTTSVTRG